MVEDLLRYLEESEGPLAYLLLGLCSAVEYVFPLFPGDTVTLFGVFLAATAGYSVVLVYASATAGSVAGGLAAYGFGRWIGRNEARWPRLLKGERTRAAIAAAEERFRRHGAAYLMLNRFVPALRAFFFVAAGIVEMPVGKVALYGGVSAALWNALLLAVGYAVGSNWERLRELSLQYTWATLALVAVVVLVLLGRWLIRRGTRR